MKSAISETTRKLWYRVNEKYGPRVYFLGEDALGRVVLCKCYTEDIAVGTNREVQKALRQLLAD